MSNHEKLLTESILILLGISAAICTNPLLTSAPLLESSKFPQWNHNRTKGGQRAGTCFLPPQMQAGGVRVGSLMHGDPFLGSLSRNMPRTGHQPKQTTAYSSSMLLSTFRFVCSQKFQWVTLRLPPSKDWYKGHEDDLMPTHGEPAAPENPGLPETQRMAHHGQRKETEAQAFATSAFSSPCGRKPQDQSPRGPWWLALRIGDSLEPGISCPPLKRWSGWAHPFHLWLSHTVLEVSHKFLTISCLQSINNMIFRTTTAQWTQLFHRP